jgi:hypothetical protein
MIRLLSWKGFFCAAALFNFVIGGALMIAPEWAFGIAFVGDPTADPGLAPALWGDFGFCVFLIGIGYLFIARRPQEERSLVVIGILAKAFDVVTLSYRTVAGVTHPIVLLPAAIDAAFMIGFAVFLWRCIRRPPQSRP